MSTPTSPRGVVLSPMRRRHLRGVVRIEREVNPRPWSHSLFAGELRLGSSRWYVVVLDGPVVVGFGGLMFTGAEAHVTNIAVDPAQRRRHHGTRIVLTLLDECRRRGVDDVTLEVRVSNRAARELYRGFGFAPGGIRRRYYADNGEDALIMWAHDLAAPASSARLEARRAALPEPLVRAGFGPATELAVAPGDRR